MSDSTSEPPSYEEHISHTHESQGAEDVAAIAKKEHESEARDPAPEPRREAKERSVTFGTETEKNDTETVMER